MYAQCCVLCAGEVSAGTLKLEDGTPFLVVVGEQPKNAAENGVTMIFDIERVTWHEGSKRPDVGNHHAAEVIENNLYLSGGLTEGHDTIQVGTIKPDGYNVAIDGKELPNKMPVVSGSAATSMIGDKVCPCCENSVLLIGVSAYHRVGSGCGCCYGAVWLRVTHGFIQLLYDTPMEICAERSLYQPRSAVDGSRQQHQFGSM